MPRRPRPRPARTGSRRRPPLGQHFLLASGVQRILQWLAPRPGDAWLEIGSGHGEITGELARLARAVVAVERDPPLAETLRQRFAPLPQVQVLEADILQISLPKVARELPVERLRVYGSLPYYITSPILQRLFSAGGCIADIHVVVQREVAERLVARPRSRAYGYLSVLTQFHTQADVLEGIPRGAFRPPPRVDSALVRLVPPGESPGLGLSDPEAFLQFAATCFRQKRKTLFNNLRPTYPESTLRSAWAQAGLDGRARAEELGLTQLASLFRLLGPPDRFAVPA